MKALKEKMEGKVKELSSKNVQARKEAWKGDEKVLKARDRDRAKASMRKATADATSKQINNMLDKAKKAEAEKRKKISNRGK
jgi:hypothetical protein|tara:strand:+ start:485 stop:730 length:246 start_codon:yes stop_codon:yes gene_type:complete